MKKLNKKNIIKYCTISGCLLSTSFCEAFHWSDLDLASINLNTVDVNAQDDWDETVLHYAAKEGNLPAIRVLLSRGAKVNDGTFGRGTPLHGAALCGQVEAMQALLEGNAEVNARDRYYYTPLHSAVSSGETEALRELAHWDADINAKDHRKQTPLHFAAERNKLGCVMELLKYNTINVNAMDCDSRTPLDVAGTPEIQNLLRDNGAKTGNAIRRERAQQGAGGFWY
ncbi:MAG: ankyrin repeat domain-containing protein [Puniceicoccales bacterium]|jgi:ankyrin repeat protein|nr:ankyrin repeat domain-containing protein [Puniceicoccales bacterium]